MAEIANDMVVESETMNDQGVRSSVDTQSRRKRHRQRRKRKIGRQQPYVAPRGKRPLTASVRAQEVRNEMFTHGQPVAPYNTTQFLIEDHGDLHDFEAQLKKAPDTHRNSRTRDSSFSVDSDDNFYYSSPDDEEEFLTREFSLEYQDLHVERLNSLSKAEIIHDYLMMESKYEKSMNELRKLKADSGRDTDASSRSDVEISEKLRLAVSENRKLKAELEKIKRERAVYKKVRHRYDSSLDSESDSSTSSSSSMDVISSADSAPSSPSPQEETVRKEDFIVPEIPASSSLSVEGSAKEVSASVLVDGSQTEEEEVKNKEVEPIATEEPNKAFEVIERATTPVEASAMEGVAAAEDCDIELKI